MKRIILTIERNLRIANSVYEMVLSGDTSDLTRPGQFINIALEGRYLRRPISVCDWQVGHLTIIYKTVGAGTLQMAGMKPGETLDTLSGLGNGFDVASSGDSPLLVGGGAGVPPLYALCKHLIKAGKKPVVLMGFAAGGDVFYEEEFKRLGVPVHISTMDGSRGTKGTVVDVMPEVSYNYVYTCGPEPMLKAVYLLNDISGQYSFEARMGCGFGACMGCSCRTITGYKRICEDGPVLQKEEIQW